MPEQDISHLTKDESFLNYCLNSNEEDVRRWEKWLSENPEYKGRVEELKNLLILLGHEAKEKEARDQFELLQKRFSAPENHIKNRRAGVSPMYVKLAIAASLLIICAIGVLLYKNREGEAWLRVSQMTKGDIRPGSNKAYLTLASGRKISLTDVSNGAIAKQSGIVITKTSEGQLVYTLSDMHTEPSASEYNMIETPRGGQYQVKLPDGTRVWLNAASSLRYPANFNAKAERRVELNGEGYFEVASDKGHPFIVETAQQEVKVLGTQFNISAYSDEPAISTTLLEGSVQVNDLFSKERKQLFPGQQSSIPGNGGPVAVTNVNADDVVAWKSGYFVFDNQDIRSIMKVISRWYDVDVEYGTINKEERFGGTFSRSADLADILRNLESLGNIHFKLKGRRIMISNVY